MKIDLKLNHFSNHTTINLKRLKILIIFLSFFLISSIVFAHTEDAELNAEIQRGRELIEKLQRGEITCQNLTDEDFHSIGEYVMEQMVGGSDHLLMNQIMERMHGKEAEELMHINMGKRYSGCYGTSTTPFWMMGPMMSPMMNMPMMGYWWGFSNWQGWNFLAPIFAILGILWMLVILIFPFLIVILLVLATLYLIKKLRSETKHPE